MGYIMTKAQTRSYDKKIMAAAIVAFIVSVIVVFINSANMNYVYHNAITLQLISCGIFLH